MRKKNHTLEFGFWKILKAKDMICSTIRNLHIPIPNFSLTYYIDIIYWQECEITWPPILNRVPREELDILRKSLEIQSFRLLKFPCHNQAFERCIKLVSKASLAAVLVEVMNICKWAKIKSRKVMPSFDNKHQY